MVGLWPSSIIPGLATSGSARSVSGEGRCGQREAGDKDGGTTRGDAPARDEEKSASPRWWRQAPKGGQGVFGIIMGVLAGVFGSDT